MLHYYKVGPSINGGIGSEHYFCTEAQARTLRLTERGFLLSIH